MTRRSLGRAGMVAVGVLSVALAGCTTALPASVVEGSTATVGWSGDVTSLNAASAGAATRANREIAAMTRGQFARVADGDVVLDESFGSVEIVDAAAASFTVRYDLAEPSWSDGIPVDAADLMLAWVAGSGVEAAAPFESVRGDLRHSTAVPELDEFERRIDVEFERPVRGWQTALDVAVPAHVAGQLAFDIDDAMEAKEAVLTAIREQDAGDLAAIAEVWNTAFALDAVDADTPRELLVSSGPYRVESIEPGESGGDRVRLAVNREYAGAPSPSYEHVELTAAPELEQLADIGDGLDVAQFDPTAENRELIRELERRDHEVRAEHVGRLWALVLRADRGVFARQHAREAFLRLVPRSDLRTAGAGSWRQAYASSESLIFGPESEGYTVALEDAGLRETFADSGSEAGFERRRAGVPAGTSVCVLHDRRQPFAVEAFAALRSAVAEAEAGWRVRTCATKDLDRAVRKDTAWDAVLTTVPIPESPRDIAATWGSDAAASLSGLRSKEREVLLAKLARTADPYDARDLRVAIEATLVSDAIAVPLAVDPVVTVASRSLEGVRVDAGRSATLMSGVADWSPRD